MFCLKNLNNSKIFKGNNEFLSKFSFNFHFCKHFSNSTLILTSILLYIR